MNLVLSLTERCNLRCTYCYYKVSHEERSLVMSEDVMEAAIRLAFERTLGLGQRFLNITFFGGEPLLRMDSIYRGVEFAKAVVRERFGDKFVVGTCPDCTPPDIFRLRFAVNTNGTLLNDSIIDYLNREDFRIFLSLDGPEQHHNICRRQVGGEGSFKLIEPHIPALLQLDTVVLSVVTRENMHTLSEAVRWVQAQGFRNMTTSVDFDGQWTGEEFDVLAAGVFTPEDVVVTYQLESSVIVAESKTTAKIQSAAEILLSKKNFIPFVLQGLTKLTRSTSTTYSLTTAMTSLLKNSATTSETLHVQRCTCSMKQKQSDSCLQVSLQPN